MKWEGKIFDHQKMVPTNEIISISSVKPWQKPLFMASPLYTFRHVGWENGKIEIKYHVNKSIHAIKFGLFLPDADARNTILMIERKIKEQVAHLA